MKDAAHPPAPSRSQRSALQCQRTDDRFQLFADHAPVGIFETDADGNCLFVNRKWCELAGLDPASAMGQGWVQALHPDDRERVTSEWYQAAKSDREFSSLYRFRSPAGRIVWLQGSAVALRDGAGNIAGYMGTVTDVTERKQAEDARRTSEQLFARFMEYLPGLAWIKDAEGRYVFANSAALQSFGCEAADLYGRRDDEIFPEETAGQFRANDQKALTSESGIQAVEILTHPDGQIHQSIVNKFPIFVRSSDASLLGGIAIDITEQLRVKEDLRESEERLRATFDQAAVGVVHVALDQRVSWVNPRLCEILGMSSESLCGRVFSDFFHPDDRHADEALFAKLVAGEVPSYRLEKRYYRNDGSLIWGDAAVSLVRDSAGLPKYRVEVLVDITERKLLEARLKAVLSSIDDHLVSYDRQWRYTFVNEGAALVLGKPKDELLGKCIWDLFPEAIGNQYYQELHAALAEQRVIRSEHYYAPFDKWFENHMYPTPEGVTVFSSDITWRKRLQEEIHAQNERLARADREKDQFLAMLAHELRNPLAPIRHVLHILKEPNVPKEVLLTARAIADRQIEHMARLLDDLLDLSRISQGRIELRKEPVEVASIVERSIESARPLISKAGHELQVSLPPEPLWINADPARIEQVLTNLLNNAAKYTDPGGRISINVECGAREVYVRVRDTGIGIARDMLTKIFDLFVQVERRLDRSQGGVGIGLTLVKKLVELHGGRIEVKSEGPGRGSEFTVAIPGPIRAEASTAASRSPKRDNCHAARRVLVVDDNRDAVESLALALEMMGHQVHRAYDGQEAIQAAGQFQPEAVLLDIGLPGTDGYQVARALRQMKDGDKILLVAITGWGREGDKFQAAESGFNHHLTKPTNLDELLDLLGEPQSEQPAHP